MRQIGLGAIVGIVAVLAAACSNSVNGAAVATGTTTTGSTGDSGGRSGHATPQAAVQALIDGVKAKDEAEIEAATCKKWPSLTGSGKFTLTKELDPPAQRAFPNGVAGDAREEGEIWKVPVTMPGDSPITVRAVREGKGYFACGIDPSGG
jgi:hypothetical protein